MSATVNILCYKSKTLANGENPLMIRVCKDGKKKYLSLGVSVKAEHWDFEKNKPKANCPNKEQILQIILEKTKEYNQQVLDYKVCNREFTATSLMETVNKPVNARTVKDVFDTYIKRLVSSNRLRYANMYKYALKSLLSFNGHLDIYFPDIEIAWLKKYEVWLQKQNLALNTIGTYFRLLRVVYNFAIEEKIVKADYYPFKTFKVSKLSESTAKRSISKDDVIRVLNYQGKSFYECLAIDLFAFSYFTAGINFADIARLTHNNIFENRLVYSRKKTKKQIKVPLQEKAIELINKYKQSNSSYLFPILSTFHKTEQQKINRVHKVYCHVSKHLKNIGKELNLPIDLTTYVARHSYSI